MKKAILISIRPEWVKKILNGEKIIEIRKTMPNCKFPIDVYIYCSHGKRGLLVPSIMEKPFAILDTGLVWLPKDKYVWKEMKPVDGKVVAKFTLSRVDEFGIGDPYEEHTRALLDKACVTITEVRKYAGGKHPYYLCHNSLYAWHISDLEVFDKQKELSDFFSLPETYHHDHESMVDYYERKEARRLKRAPQSWQYVEVEE